VPSQKNNKDYEQLGRMLDNIYQSGYIDRNQMYKTSFIKGVVAGFGGVIGATVVVGLLLWILSLFSDLPLVDTIRETIQSGKH